MKVLTGLDGLIKSDFAILRRKRIGIVCNQASISGRLKHALEELKLAKTVELGAIFGPQHGLFGHTQDNMIEWEAGDSLREGTPIYSLYGENRQPTPEKLEGLDELVIDLPDVGARYYTFIWTMALCMKAAEPLGLPVRVLDRPNPIGGVQVEGTVLDPEYSSFVGLYPLPMRHGLTIGEVAKYLKYRYFPAVNLSVEPLQNWSRDTYFPETGLPWAMPSPNMPTFDTALVYPGMCLLEGTNLSEGRGTTRPFEIFGAPFLNARSLCTYLDDCKLPGVHFRETEFQPTFQKHAGQLCEGATIHVIDRESFSPVMTAMAILQACVWLAPKGLKWNPPPYEYEFKKLPIDILFGNGWLRGAIEGRTSLREIGERMRAELSAFTEVMGNCKLY